MEKKEYREEKMWMAGRRDIEKLADTMKSKWKGEEREPKEEEDE